MRLANGRSGRSPLWGLIGVAALASVFGLTTISPLALGATSQAGPEPIEGIWAFPNIGYPNRVEVVATGPQTFVGTVLESDVECLPVGLDVWHLQGSGNTYTGTVYWYDYPCAERGQGETVWEISEDGSMRFCSVDPKDPNRTDCVTFERARQVLLSGPEFIERAERFEFDVEIVGVDSCAGLQIALLKEVAGAFGIIKKVDAQACDLTIKQRLRKSANFKARIIGDTSSDSPVIMVEVR